MSNKMYTLDEARLEMGRQECRQYDHDLDLIQGGYPRQLLSVFCSRCGSAWAVTQTHDGLADG